VRRIIPVFDVLQKRKMADIQDFFLTKKLIYLYKLVKSTHKKTC